MVSLSKYNRLCCMSAGYKGIFFNHNKICIFFSVLYWKYYMSATVGILCSILPVSRCSGLCIRYTHYSLHMFGFSVLGSHLQTAHRYRGGAYTNFFAHFGFVKANLM